MFHPKTCCGRGVVAILFEDALRFGLISFYSKSYLYRKVCTSQVVLNAYNSTGYTLKCCIVNDLIAIGFKGK